ncbi:MULTISPECIES: TetR/AcrR family transcriptional regulator C-terminal domain-containing protein [unclassified Enterococcus]|uniref:TetR family transcriptional regulator n=1 Tax=unclassified Enterococcus TaxID=2608891 RepID=UPI0013EAE2BF|nr:MULTISPECIES: TetR/AcrR family transcriptional regulator C-terminal domain-containing protein [unclassified Enterococcus]
MEPKLSQATIIQTAFDILAEKQELSQLSMRSLAKAANVQAPALYWYFKNKQQLLQKMAETMENGLAIPDPTLPWKEQLLQFMENYYDLYTQFPCGAELEIHTVPAFPSRLEHLEQMIQILVNEGFSVARSHQAISALHNLLVGQLMDQQHEQQLRQKIIKGNVLLKDTVSYMRQYVNDHQLNGLTQSIMSHVAVDGKEVFLTSVETFLLGLSVQK